jgi:DNA-directed RNA polymerase subunit RPC12/RpoP
MTSKRRQILIYSLLEKVRIDIAEEMTPADPAAPPPINAELAPGSTGAAPAPAPDLSQATEVSVPLRRGVAAAALAPKEISPPPPEILRLPVIKCPSCGYRPLSRLERKLWMRLLPASRYYLCYRCSMKFFAAYKWTVRWGKAEKWGA